MTDTAPVTTSSELKDVCIAAIAAALVSRGARQGSLKASCPPSASDAAAAWQAITGHANPFKMGIATIMFFSDRQRAIYDAIDKSITSKSMDVRNLDRDRVALERLRAW